MRSSSARQSTSRHRDQGPLGFGGAAPCVVAPVPPAGGDDHRGARPPRGLGHRHDRRGRRTARPRRTDRSGGDDHLDGQRSPHLPDRSGLSRQRHPGGHGRRAPIDVAGRGRPSCRRRRGGGVRSDLRQGARRCRRQPSEAVLRGVVGGPVAGADHRRADAPLRTVSAGDTCPPTPPRPPAGVASTATSAR